MKNRSVASVVGSTAVGSMVLVRLRVPGWRSARPGQFAMLQVEGSSCFLPRAFSVHAQLEGSSEGADVSFLVAAVGDATHEIASLSPGDQVWILGPLGHGFTVVDDARRSDGWVRSGRLLIVGGGVGVAPFLLTLDTLRRRAADRPYDAPSEVRVLFGFRDNEQAECLALFQPAVDALRSEGVQAQLEGICEDGSLGRPGLVTDLLAESVRAGDTVLACGAHAMCAAVWRVCQEAGDDVDVWFSLEAGMACGVGSCLGCVMTMGDGTLARVCREGPVFAGRDVFGAAPHPCAAPEAREAGS